MRVKRVESIFLKQAICVTITEYIPERNRLHANIVVSVSVVEKHVSRMNNTQRREAS